jgi:peptide/nickel transport system permease protein
MIEGSVILYKFVIKRILLLIPILIGVTFIVFSVMSLTPGDPGTLILGINAKAEAIEKMNHDLGYDKPFLIRFANYMIGVFQGDFGTSYLTGKPVFIDIFERFPVTFKVAVLSMILAIIIGLSLGILSAVKQYSVIDTVSTVIAMFAASIPQFWLGLMLMLVFSLKLKWLPTSGLDSIKGYILPSLTLAIGVSASLLRMTRSAMLETIRQDYIRTARAKGVSEAVVIWKHALKNALLPVVTVIGMIFGALMGGSVLVEAVFGLPGLGTLTLTAMRAKDVPMVMATQLFFSIIFMLIMLLVDILYAYIDPRIKSRYSK